MRQFELSSSLGHLLITVALFSPLITGQSVYAIEQQSHVWNTPDEQTYFSGVVPANPSFQESQDQVPIPTATLTPTSPANIRNLPGTKGTEITGQAAKGSRYPVLGFVTRDDGRWYYLSLPEGGYGWVRSDVVPTPEGDDIWDLTDVAAVPLAMDGGKPGEQLLQANINLAFIKSALDTLVNRGVPAETFTLENLEVIGIQSQNLIFRLKYAEQGSEAGTVVVIVANEDTLQAVELFHPSQLRDIFAQNGIAADGEFSAANTPDQYCRFGSTVLLNYEQAATQLSQGTSVEDALLSSIVVTDAPFPATLFSISTTDTGTQIVFTEGQAYDLSQNEGESFLRAKKSDITAMTPTVVAALLNLPQGNYTFDTNAYYGPNKMLKDASGNVVAVLTATADAWQTVDTLMVSMNLDTKAENGTDLHYFFDASDPLNLFLRENSRGIQSILDERDQSWFNLRTPFVEQMVPNGVFPGFWRDRDTMGNTRLYFQAISWGTREDLQLPLRGIPAEVTGIVRGLYVRDSGGRGNPSDMSLETALIAQHVDFNGINLFMSKADGSLMALTQNRGTRVECSLPLDRARIALITDNRVNEIDSKDAFIEFVQQYYDTNQDTINTLLNNGLTHDPLVLIAEPIPDPTEYVHFN